VFDCKFYATILIVDHEIPTGLEFVGDDFDNSGDRRNKGEHTQEKYKKFDNNSYHQRSVGPDKLWQY